MPDITSASRYAKGILYELNLSDLQTDPDQPRKYFDPAAQQDLVDSFRKQGVLQPILFRADQNGVLFIVAGERRFQAAKEAGLATIPALLVEGSYSEIALVENLLRQDLTAIETAEALDRMMKEQGYNQEQLTTIVGKAKSTVSEILSLNRLPEEIKNECRTDAAISRKILLEIAKKKQSRSMLTSYRKYKERLSTPHKVRTERGRRNSRQERIIARLEDFITFVSETDLETLDDTARNDLLSCLDKLKTATDRLISQIQGVDGKGILETSPAGEPSAPGANDDETTAPEKRKILKQKRKNMYHKPLLLDM